MGNLLSRKCVPGKEAKLLSPDQVRALLSQIPGWQVEEGRLVKVFRLRDHYQAVAFLNAVAWISHRQDHHPFVELGFNTLRVVYWTHAVEGLSENDFICAAKVDWLFQEGEPISL